MSIAASAWAKKIKTGSSARKALLMVLAEYATVIEGWPIEGSDGRHYAWPGQRRLAAETEMSERAVRDHLGGLEEAGIIRRLRRGGEGEGRRPDMVILAVDDDGPRPFPEVEAPAEANRQDLPVGATGRSEQGNRQNGATAPITEPPSEQAAPSRGTRLPDDFAVTDEMRIWYREKIGGSIDGQIEHEKFVDYWRSRSGQIAVKKDWPAAWRNWMREAMQRSGRRPSSGATKPSAPRYPTAQERSAQRLDDFRERALEAEAWLREHGGNPDDNQQVLAVMERIKEARAKGSATRTPDMYSEGDVFDGEVVAPREVTAGEGV